MYPPLFLKAITVACNQSDWQCAINIAHQYTAVTSTSTTINHVLKIVQEIVNNFKQNQEIGTFDALLDFTILPSYIRQITLGTSLQTTSTAMLPPPPLTTTTTSSTNNNNNNFLRLAAIDVQEWDILLSNDENYYTRSNYSVESKAMQAARLSIDYLQDVESAVTILINAQHYLPALEFARRYQRNDLIDEVSELPYLFIYLIFEKYFFKNNFFDLIHVFFSIRFIIQFKN
jgi:hypothetical protein